MALLACAPQPNAGSAEQRTIGDRCDQAGQWFDPATGRIVPHPEVFARLSEKRIILLGERHASPEHHTWQLQVLAGLHASVDNLVVGFEAFPRAAQPVLNEWTRGGLTAEQFLKAVQWNDVWGYPADLYMPMFDFSRQNRLSMLAINVDRALISEVAQKGWQGIKADAREGVGDPASATEAYRLSLAKVYQAKLRHPRSSLGKGEKQGSNAKLPELDQIMANPRFGKFVEAQLTWDRAMAEALAKASRAAPEATVVGILGRGHVEYGWGVPHQLAALGLKDVAFLLPTETGVSCRALQPGVADTVFLVDPIEPAQDAPKKPKLGVVIEAAAAGIRVRRVVEGSVGADAALKPDDVITTAAGLPVRRNQDLIDIIQRQAPGTWLPLNVDRDGKTLQIIAKFPPDPGTSK
ncbi:MAG: ChaN family lipoprotein [Rhodospirillaceae bacterium]